MFNKLEASSNTLFGKIGVFEPSSSVNRDGLYRLFFHSTYTDGGGNNNIIEPGETIKVNVAVKSQWSNAKNVRVRIAQKSGKENPDVKILKDESRIDKIPANSVVSTEKDPFIVKISEGAAINSEFYLTVLMSTTEGYSHSMTSSSTRDHSSVKPLLINPKKQEPKDSSQITIENYVEIDESDEKKENNLKFALENNKYVILNVGATWCAPCKALQPAYIATSFLFKDVYFVHVNIDKPAINGDVTNKLFPKIFVLPTLVFIQDQKEIGTKIVGVPKDNPADNIKYLTEKINEYFKKK